MATDVQPQSPEPIADPHGKAKRNQRRVLNVRLLVGTILVLGVGYAGAYGLRRVQLRRTAHAMLDRAETLIAEGKYLRASEYYFRYLRVEPHDAAVRRKLAETFDRGAVTARERGRAIELYYEAAAAAAAEDQPAIRCRLAVLLLDAGLIEAAVEEAGALIQKDAADAVAWRVFAMGSYWSARIDARPSNRNSKESLGTLLETAVAKNPADPQLALALAYLYRETPRWLSEDKQALDEAARRKAADAIVDQLVSKADSPEAYLARHGYRRQYQLPGGQDDLQAALQRGPRNVVVLLAAAEQARLDARAAAAASEKAKASDEQAMVYYQRAIEAAPQDERAYVGMGQIYFARGQADQAIATWQRGQQETHRKSVDLLAPLANALILQRRFDEAHAALADLDRLVEPHFGQIQPSQKESAERLRFKESIRRVRDLLYGTLAAAEGKPWEAIPLLRRAAQDRVSGDVAENLQAWRLVAACCEKLEEWDRAALAYEEAMALAPSDARFRLSAAMAWMAAERPDMARPHLTQLAAKLDTPDLWLQLAVVEYYCQMRILESARDWSAFDAAVKEAARPRPKQSLTDPWRLKLLEAGRVAATIAKTPHPEQASQTLSIIYRSAEKESPDNPAILKTLVLGYERAEAPADADRVLADLDRLRPNDPETPLLHAKLLSARKDYAAARKLLLDRLAQAKEEDKAVIRRELLQIGRDAAQPEQIEKDLLSFHAAEPDNPRWLCQLAHMALDAGRMDQVGEYQRKLRALEGPESVSANYFDAAERIARAASPDAIELAEAAELQARVVAQRSTWPDAHVLKGLIADRRGNWEQAIEAYEEAIRLGERRVAVFERLIALLDQFDRAAEADQYLAMLPREAADSTRLSLLGISLAPVHGQSDRVLEIARQGTQRRPNDPLARLWLAQMLLANGKTAEAESAARRAAELAPDDVRVLSGLLVFYGRSRQRDKIRWTLDEILHNAKLPAAQQAALAGQAYEVLAERENALAQYRRAVAAAPQDNHVNLLLAGFLLSQNDPGSLDEAETLLRAVVRRSPEISAARRLLAGLLAGRGGEEQWQEAQHLLVRWATTADPTPIDRQTEAMLLFRRGGRENLDTARQILESLVADARRSSVADRFWLARVYDTQGNAALARQQYLKLLDVKDPRPEHVAALVDLLLRQPGKESRDEAAAWLKKIEAATPDSLGVALLRARWLQAEGRGGEIEPLVEPLASRLAEKTEKSSPYQAALALRVGSIYTTVGNLAAAERWHRRAWQQDHAQYASLTGVLAQQGRVKEAIEVCASAASDDPSARPVATLVTAVLSGPRSAKEYAAVETFVAAAAARRPDDPEIPFNMANLLTAQGRVDDAVRLYREVVRMRPKDAPALNNLATLLAERDETRAEGLELVGRAIAVRGPHPALVETRAMILLQQGKAEQAIPMLEELVAMPDCDARRRIHLAAAYVRSGDLHKADATLAAASQEELASQILVESDRKMLEDLKRKLKRM